MKKRILLCMLVCMLFALLTTALATEGCEHKNYEKVSVVREGNCKLNQTRVLKVNCKDCTETEILLDLGLPHNYQDDYVEPTCTKPGKAGKHCNLCDKWVDSVQILDALGHDWENGNVPFTNCEVPSGPHRVCKRNGCGEDEWLAGSVGVKDHTFAKTETSIEPTCEDTGTYYYACTVEGCSGVKEDPKPALGHNVVEDIIPATCVAKGYTTHRCDRNGCTYKEDATDYTDGFDSTNHIDKGYRVFLAATCTVPGAKREVCSACDTELGSAVRIDPLGHSKPDAKTTYLTDDKGMYYTCTNFRNGKDGELCGEKQYVDACKLGFHVYIKVEAKEATCVEGGWKEFKYCKVCETEEAIKNENLLPIDPENHDKEIIDAKAATCLEDGNEEGWRCKREGCTAGEGGATITATGHQWGEWVVVTKPTYDKDGERTRTCNVCSKTEEEGIPKLNEYDVNGDGKVTLADVKKLFNSGASLADVKKAFNIAWESAE